MDVDSRPGVSDIVLSISGRDAGKHFVVLAAYGEYLTLADGRGRRSEKPKRKKRKHTKYVCGTPPSKAREKLCSGEKVTNAELRRVLSDYYDSIATEGGMQIG